MFVRVYGAWLRPGTEVSEVGSMVVYVLRGYSAAQSVEGLGVEILPGIGGTELEQDATHADPNDGADLQQLEADGIHLGLGPGSTFQSQAPQRFHQGVSHGGEVETQLVAFHFVGGEPVGEQAHLLLDAVLHLSPGAVELLV